MYTESLLDARHCSRDWECCREQGPQCLETYKLAGETEKAGPSFSYNCVGHDWKTINYTYWKYTVWLVLTYVVIMIKITNISATARKFPCALLWSILSSLPMCSSRWTESTSNAVQQCRVQELEEPGWTPNLVKEGFGETSWSRWGQSWYQKVK